MSGHLVVGVAERVDGSFTVVLAIAGESIELADTKVLLLARALGEALADCRRRRRGKADPAVDPIRLEVHPDD